MVTIDELYKYVETQSQNEARTIGKTAKEKETVPYIVGEDASHFVVTHNPDLARRCDRTVELVDGLILHTRPVDRGQPRAAQAV